MSIVDVRSISNQILSEIRMEVSSLTSKGLRPPHLAAILVGNDPASQAYVNNKFKTCEKVGFRSSVFRFDAETDYQELVKCIRNLNDDPETDGFILQLPLPAHLDADALLMEIDPEKDVDGFHPLNVGKMVLGLQGFWPATPYGIVLLLEKLNLELSGKKVAVLGRSNIVGTPMSLLMSRKAPYGNATVTLLHSRSKNISQELLDADIIIAAIGIPEYVKGHMVKDGAVVIDVGINRIEDTKSDKGYKLVGDVDLNAVSSKASLITPVPGGIGLMTIVGLMKNTLNAYRKSSNYF